MGRTVEAPQGVAHESENRRWTAVTRDIRKDWDLSDPELKKRWDAGDKSDFYPYGVKSMEQTLKEMAGAVDQYAGKA